MYSKLICCLLSVWTVVHHLVCLQVGLAACWISAPPDFIRSRLVWFPIYGQEIEAGRKVKGKQLLLRWTAGFVLSSQPELCSGPPAILSPRSCVQLVTGPLLMFLFFIFYAVSRTQGLVHSGEVSQAPL